MDLTAKSSTVVPFRRPPSEVSDQKTFTAQKLAWVERIQSDRIVPPLARCLATVIGLKYLSRVSGDAWPSQATLAADLGVTIRAIQKSLDRLVDAGHLHRAVPSATLGRGHTNHYRPEYGVLRANAGSPIGEEGRTAEQERANGCAKKGEHSFVQNPLKRTHLSRTQEEEVSANGSYEGRKKQAAEPKQLAAETMAAPMNGSSDGTFLSCQDRRRLRAEQMARAKAIHDEGKPQPPPAWLTDNDTDPDASF